MDSTPELLEAATLSLLDLSSWVGWQLDNWVEWAEARGGDDEWLTWPTLNERNPTIGALFMHAFSPLHRYADQVAGDEPADDSGLNHASWVALHTWARQCQQRHYSVCAELPLAEAARIVDFRTRSAGIIRVSIAEAMTHAATHCFWHLGGIAHLLRLGGTSPPQRSDLILWAAARHEMLAEAEPGSARS